MDFGIISADDHIDLRFLPRDLWQTRVPAALRDHAPRVEDRPEGPMWVCGDSVWTPWGRGGHSGLKWAVERDGSYDGAPRPTIPALRLADMDRDGVDASVMYGPVSLLQADDPQVRQLCYTAYNDWLVEFCAAEPRRLIGAGMLPADDPALAAQELQRLAKLRLRHAMLLAALAAPPIYHPAWEPFWAAAAETRIPVGIHLFVGPPAPQPGVSALALSVSNGVQAPLQLVDPLVALIFSGVFERYPDLRLVLAESGIAWLPFTLQRMDREYGKYRHFAREFWEQRGGIPLTMRPSEYFQRQVWATFQDDPVGLANVDFIGEDRVMWASDYPHPDSTWPHSQAVIAGQMADLSEAARRKITRDNARALYGLN
jgi:predicted TIM-barrel fold metal-dependent hydrolase